jgi:hypothetical protein
MPDVRIVVLHKSSLPQPTLRTNYNDFRYWTLTGIRAFEVICFRHRRHPMAGLVAPEHRGRVELWRLRFRSNHWKGRASVVRSSHFSGKAVINTTDDQSQTSSRRYTQP